MLRQVDHNPVKDLLYEECGVTYLERNLNGIRLGRIANSGISTVSNPKLVVSDHCFGKLVIELSSRCCLPIIRRYWVIIRIEKNYWPVDPWVTKLAKIFREIISCDFYFVNICYYVVLSQKCG